MRQPTCRYKQVVNKESRKQKNQFMNFFCFFSFFITITSCSSLSSRWNNNNSYSSFSFFDLRYCSFVLLLFFVYLCVLCSVVIFETMQKLIVILIKFVWILCLLEIIDYCLSLAIGTFVSVLRCIESLFCIVLIDADQLSVFCFLCFFFLP